MNSVTRLIVSEDILEIEPEVEAIDLAEAVRQPFLAKVDAVAGAGEVALDEHRAARGHHDELAAAAHIAPVEVAQRLVAHIVVEGEAEQAGPAARATGEGELAVEVGEVERQPLLVNVAVEHLGALLEVAALPAEDEGGAPAPLIAFAERPFDQELAAERAGPDAAAQPGEAAVPGRDVHDRADPPAIPSAEATGVDVRVGNDVRVEDAEEADAVEGIVDDHAVQQDLVLDGRASADVQLAALVPCRNEAGQGLQNLHEIRRAPEAGNAFDVRRLDGFDRHANRIELFAPFRGNDRALQLDESSLERDVLGQHPVIPHHHFRPEGLVFDAGDDQRVGTGGHLGQTVVALDVGGDPVGRPFEDDRSKQHRSTVLFGPDKSLHRSLSQHQALPSEEGEHHTPAPPRRP